MDFIDDDEKMRDFFMLTKDEFLESYSYLKEEDYDATKKLVETRENLELVYVGDDSWDRPVYKDKSGNLYKDTSLGQGNNLKSSLYTANNNEFEGEPNFPIDKNVIVKVIRYIPIREIKGNEDLHKIARQINFETDDNFMPEDTKRNVFLRELETQIEWELGMSNPSVSKKILMDSYNELLKIKDKENKLILSKDENDITKLDFLKEIKDMVCHNIVCYSENYWSGKAKKGYEKEFIKENKKLMLVEQMIKEEKQKDKQKDKKEEAR